MAYDPLIHHRRSIRLKGYDYSKAGLYFVTLCVQDKDCLFGKVVDGKMILNDAGMMIEKWYRELENKYPDKKCHEMVVMPNHFHFIIENVGTIKHKQSVCPVGADLRVCPNEMGEHVGSPQRGSPQRGSQKINSPLFRAIQWLKTMTTNEYIRGVKQHKWIPFKGKLWQRDYYEHIIRNEKSYRRISQYIINNPKKWQADKFNK